MASQVDSPKNGEAKRRLGLRISVRREARGISQRQFAQSLDMDHVNLWKIEKGASNVKFDTLCKIAEGLGVEVEDLFRD